MNDTFPGDGSNVIDSCLARLPDNGEDVSPKDTLGAPCKGNVVSVVAILLRSTIIIIRSIFTALCQQNAPHSS